MALLSNLGSILSLRIFVGIAMSMHFDSELAFANEDILFCHKHLQELKDNVNDWNKRCMVDNYLEVNTAQCSEEKTYNQARIRKHTSQCFYEGNFIF